MHLTIYSDYNCEDSFRLGKILDAVADQSPLEVEWRTYSRKHQKSLSEGVSLFDDEEVGSFSILMLVVAHALRGTGGDFARYHREVMRAVHEDRTEMSRADLLQLGADCGLDVAGFEGSKGRWLHALAAEHAYARDELKVFGTPTVVFGEGPDAFYVEFSQIPDSMSANEAWAAVERLAQTPGFAEMKRTS